MAVLQLFSKNTADFYSYRVRLDETIFRIKFLYNRRSDTWNLQIFDSDENHLNTVALVTNLSLFNRFNDEALPLGRMILFNLAGNETRHDDLGINSTVIYETVS